MRKTITVSYLNKLSACKEAVEMFANQKETDTIKILQGTMKINHFNWANWLIVRLMNRKQKLQYSIFAAESVIDIYEKKHPNDKRPRKAIEAVKKVLKYDSKKNRTAAYAAADAAYAAAYAADAAAADAADAYAADATAYAAADAAAYAAYAADAADAYAADATAYAAAYAADAYAADAARKKLQKKIINYGIKLLRSK